MNSIEMIQRCAEGQSYKVGNIWEGTSWVVCPDPEEVIDLLPEVVLRSLEGNSRAVFTIKIPRGNV